VDKTVVQLIELGREQGYVTYADINRLFPPEDSSPDDLKTIINLLTENDVEILQGAAEEEEAEVEATEEVDPDTFFSDDDDWVLDTSDDDQDQKEPEPEPTPQLQAKTPAPG